MKRVFTKLTAVIFCLGLLILSSINTRGQGEGAEKFFYSANPIPNRYIVVLEDWATGPLGENSQAPSVAADLTKDYGGTVDHIYQYALNGYSVEMSSAAALLLSQDTRVKYVEEDTVGTFSQVQSNPPNWGLDRIDQRLLPLNSSYSYNRTGSGVTVFVIDSGVTPIPDFGNRVGHSPLADFSVGPVPSGLPAGWDCFGHGTHVAGIIGSNTYGVAKGVGLFSVKVGNCMGGTNASILIAGINYVAQNRTARSVANMSFGIPASAAMDQAVRNLQNLGVICVTSAGNSNVDAINTSPARVGEILTVGASTITDQKAGFSNFGAVVDIYAPGNEIRSSSYLNDPNGVVMSGTSMSAPHISGLVANLTQSGGPGIIINPPPPTKPSTVIQMVKSFATTDKYPGIPAGIVTRLLYANPNIVADHPINDQRFFVWQQYLDFLNREPDNAGFEYWVGQIVNSCTTFSCTEERRRAVATAFFYAPEFLQSRPGLRNPPGVSPDFNNAEFVRQLHLVFYRRLPTAQEFSEVLDRLNSRTATQQGGSGLGYQQTVQEFITNQPNYLNRF